MRPDDDDTLDGVVRDAVVPPTTELDAVTTEVNAPRRVSASRLGLVAIAVAAGSFLVGVGTGAVTRPKAVDPLLVAQEVGPSGGTVRFEGGEVRVPEGALAQSTPITVRRSVVDRRVTIDPGTGKTIAFPSGTLVAYAFGPVNVRFAKPVQLTFRLPAGADNGTVFARSATGGIVLLAGRIDVDRGTASTSIRDFRFGGAA